MKSFTVNKNDSGQRIDKFIQKAVPSLPSALMFKYFRIKRIKLNGKKTQISTRIAEGDTIDCYINDEFFEAAPKNYDFLSAPANLKIIYEDENIMLIDKPQGILVHPDKDEYRDTLIGRIQHYLYDKGEYNPDEENSFKPALANRIDRNTGGIVIAAKNALSLRILCDKIRDREIDKKYIAVCHGHFNKKVDTIISYLEKNEDKNQVYLKKEASEGTRTAKTKYRCLDEKNNLTLIEVHLLTGRTHQIRAQMASTNHPLLGDGKYGKNAEDKKKGFKCQALYSYKLEFAFISDAGILEYLNHKTFTVDEVWFANELFGKKWTEKIPEDNF